MAKVKVPVIPVLEMPDGSFNNDSTALIYELEQRHPDRRVVPPAPALAFLAHLIEDFADEWLTKAMFGYRWLAEVDQVQMSRWLAFDNLKGGGIETSQANAEMFRQRQVGRMAIVGCTAENFPLIETTTRETLDALETRVTDGFFLFGTRPSLAEFGIYGQLSQLGVDPTPQAVMRSEYPYTYRWLDHIGDLSGCEGRWSEEPDEAAIRIAAVAAEVYAPFLAANAAALEAQKTEFAIEVRGMSYSQGTFKYQAKCLVDLRRRYLALGLEERGRVDGWIGDDWIKLLQA